MHHTLQTPWLIVRGNMIPASTNAPTTLNEPHSLRLEDAQHQCTHCSDCGLWVHRPCLPSNPEDQLQLLHPRINTGSPAMLSQAKAFSAREMLSALTKAHSLKVYRHSCMYMCVYVYVYVWMFVYAYVCICVYISICVYICICVYVYICICVYMYARVYAYVCICITIYVFMYMCVYVYVCLSTLWLFWYALGLSDNTSQCVC